jgi:hypothetical protein
MTPRTRNQRPRPPPTQCDESTRGREGGTGVGVHAGKQRDQNLGVAKLDTPAKKVSAREESGSGSGQIPAGTDLRTAATTAPMLRERERDVVAAELEQSCQAGGGSGEERNLVGPGSCQKSLVEHLEFLLFDCRAVPIVRVRVANTAGNEGVRNEGALGEGAHTVGGLLQPIALISLQVKLCTFTPPAPHLELCNGPGRGATYGRRRQAGRIPRGCAPRGCHPRTIPGGREEQEGEPPAS